MVCVHTPCRLEASLLRDLTGRVKQVASKLTSRQLPLTLWAFATLGHAPVAALPALDNAVAESAASFTPQGLSIALWAFRIFQHKPCEDAKAALVAAVTAQMEDMKPHELANALEAFATLRIDPGVHAARAVASHVGGPCADTQSAPERMPQKPALASPGAAPLADRLSRATARRDAALL